jgi:hypothetical protein
MPDPIPPARPATDEEVADFRSQYSDRDVACLELVPAILARLDAAEAERDALAKNLHAIVEVCGLAGVGSRGQTVLCRVKDLAAQLGHQIGRADAAEKERDALMDGLEAYQKLVVAYRVGRQPGEKTLDAIAKCRDTLAEAAKTRVRR